MGKVKDDLELTAETFARLRDAALHAAIRAGAGPWSDVVADEALLRFVKYDGHIDHPLAFIRKVAHNAALDLRRKQPAGGWAQLPPSTPPPGQAPPGALIEESASVPPRREDVLERVLAVVTPTERALLRGQADGMSLEELARAHGYTPKSVKSMLSAARAKIRAAFPDHADLLDLS